MKGAAKTGRNVAIVAIARNEAPYLIEWIAHYRRLGAAEIIVFDNESVDETYAMLERLASKGVLRTGRILDRDCNTVAPQIAAYRRGIALARTEWILFCDIDEFLHIEFGRTLDEYVATIESDVSLVALNWRAFGSSGVRAFVDRPVTERFVMGAFPCSPVNMPIKSLARRAHIRKPGVHLTRVTQGRYVHADGSPFARRANGDGTTAKSEAMRIVLRPAALAHFGTKSKTEFRDKIARGRAGLNARDPRRMTTRGAARTKWKNYNINETMVDYFIGTAEELRSEIKVLKSMLGFRLKLRAMYERMVTRIRRQRRVSTS